MVKIFHTLVYLVGLICFGFILPYIYYFSKKKKILFKICVDDTLQHLSVVEKNPRLTRNLARYRNMKKYQVDLRLYRMLLRCVPDAADAGVLANMNSFAASIVELYKLDADSDSFALTNTEYKKLLRNVQEHRRNCFAGVKKNCSFQHLMSSFLCEAKPKPSCFISNNRTMEFLESLHAIFNDHLRLDKIIIPTLYNCIESLVKSLFFLRDLVYYTNPPLSDSIFQFNVDDWANKAACFSLLDWFYGFGAETRRGLLIDLREKVDPCNLDFINFCFQVIKVPKMKCEDRLLFGEFVSRFVDFFFDKHMRILNDRFPMIREGLIFLITFLADPPANTLIHSQFIMPFVRERISGVLDQASDIMCFFRDTNIDLSRGNTILDDFLKYINEVRGDIVNHYVHIPPLSWSTFPRINKLGYLESLLAYLENLKDTMNNNRKLVPFLKHQIFTIHQELLPLRSILLDTWMIQNEHSELKDISEQIMSLLCHADFAIKSSFFIENSIWYNLTFLSFLVRKIKDIRSEIKNIEFGTQAEGSDICKPLMSAIDVQKPSTSTSTVEDVVGFGKETDLLIDRLVCGSAQLDIVPIVGMGGIGKTTIAKKLYNEVEVKNHFYRCAFCSVSQVYIKRNVLLAILRDLSPDDDTIRQMSDLSPNDDSIRQMSDLSPNDDSIRQMSVDDLAQRLRQSLLGYRYLIVVDDIWDINVWDDLKASFPNEGNGSRIIFTTRISNLSKSTPCRLPFLSVDESWELLQLKVFRKDPCPPRLLEVGKMIAKNCKGLPLSIVVIAGLLSRTGRNFVYWKEVADTLSSFASSEGCNEIIKLSYKHLPEALKSCFLYFGAFAEDDILGARPLTYLWVAEGFVVKSEGGSLHKIAKKYLNDLSDRNLVTVTQKSCNGGIKYIQVHDVIRDFCITEAQEEKHLYYINAHNKNFPMSRVLYQHRIRMEGECRSFVNAEPRCSTVHSLLYLDDRERNTYHFKVKSLESFLSNFKLVQVLNLLGIMIDGEFPMTITTLVHLRYLALRFFADVYVPPDIINLWNLETLILLARDENLNKVLAFPMDIWKVNRLKHVELTANTRIALGNVRGGVSLLPDLISFGFVIIPNGEKGGELLRRLSNVRKFRCFCSGMWVPYHECNKLPKLEILTKLESLFMVYVGEVRPPYMFSFPSTLRKLTLNGFSLPWNEFSALMRMLPCLEVLVLLKDAFSGKRWDVEDEQFPTIKYLTLYSLDIEEWNALVDSFPNLVKLVVVSCLQLIAIPPCFGEVVTLMSIHVNACKKSVADSAIQIEKDQFDYGNESFEVELFNIQT